MKEIGKHDFDGACAPSGYAPRCETFSLGIFEWVQKSGGSGVKRGPVKVRVKGSTGNPEDVFAKARSVVAALDAGTYSGPKVLKV